MSLKSSIEYTFLDPAQRFQFFKTSLIEKYLMEIGKFAYEINWLCILLETRE